MVILAYQNHMNNNSDYNTYCASDMSDIVLVC